MHGFIFTEVRKYVETNFSRDAWFAILREAGLPEKEYENFLDYSDGEAVAILSSASQATGKSVDAILEDFGIFLGGDLIQVYRPVIDESWKTLEFLINVEETIHQVVRSRNRAAHPPALSCDQTGPSQVKVVYRSPRKMCALARGIVRGVATHYGDPVTINETTCMHRGGDFCEIVVTQT